MDKQKTFGEIVGMESIVPAAQMPSDIITCEDGTECEREDAFEDCRGNYFADADACFESNVAIVTEILASFVECQTQYYTENTDYPNGFPLEDDFAIKRGIDEWVDSNFDDFPYKDWLREELYERIESMDSEPEYSANEYSAYSGRGCCIDSFALGECEEQISRGMFDEIDNLFDSGELSAVLDVVDIDGCIRDTGRDDFYIYTYPGGRWDFVVSDDIMRQATFQAIIDYCEKKDSMTCEFVVEFTDAADTDAYLSVLVKPDDSIESIMAALQDNYFNSDCPGLPFGRSWMLWASWRIREGINRAERLQGRKAFCNVTWKVYKQ